MFVLFMWIVWLLNVECLIGLGNVVLGWVVLGRCWWLCRLLNNCLMWILM